MDTVTVTLATPVKVGEKEYASLTFRKAKAKDLIASDAVSGEARKSMALYASMGDVPIKVIEELDLDDFEDVSEKVVPLMGKKATAAAAKLAAEKSDSKQETP
jgi:phage FluMu protein gp41